MLNIRKVQKGLYYVEYCSRFVQSFDTLREAKYFIETSKKLLPV